MRQTTLYGWFFRPFGWLFYNTEVVPSEHSSTLDFNRYLLGTSHNRIYPDGYRNFSSLQTNKSGFPFKTHKKITLSKLSLGGRKFSDQTQSPDSKYSAQRLKPMGVCSAMRSAAYWIAVLKWCLIKILWILWKPYRIVHSQSVNVHIILLTSILFF